MPLPTDRSGANTAAEHNADHNLLHALFNQAAEPWITYTPTFAATTTNPTLGTGGTISAKYKVIGKTMFVRVKAQFGTSGASGGSGTYSITLPPTFTVAFEQYANLGHGVVYDSAPTPTFYICHVQQDDTINRVNLLSHAATAAVGATTPFSFGNNDSVMFNITYEVT